MSANFQHVIDAVGWTLFHVLWQATLAGVTVVFLRRYTRRRYELSTAAMGFLAVTIILTLAWQCHATPFQTTKADNNVILATDSLELLTEKSAPSLSLPIQNPTVAEAATRQLLETKISSVHETPTASKRSPMAWIVTLWAVGVVVFLCRLLFDLIAVHQLKSGSKFLPANHPCSVSFEDVLQRVNVTRTIRLMVSERLSVPVTFGVFRPIIVLPTSLLTGLPQEQVEAILLHELAHVRRFDYAINLLQSLMETMFFFHPVVWWLSRQMRIERELCCDDSAAAEGASVGVYAAALLALEDLQPCKIPALALAANGVRRGSLLHRIRRLSGKSTPDTSGSWIVIVAGISVALTCVSLIGQEADPPASQTQFQLDPLTQPSEPENVKDESKESVPSVPLAPLQSVFGVVVDEAGKPIPDVKVQAASPRQGFHSSFSVPTGGEDIEGKSTITDAEGKFRIDQIHPRGWKPNQEGRTPVMLRFRSPYRWINDQNYSLGETLKIQLNGSGQKGTLRMQLIDDETAEPLTVFTIVKRHRATTEVTTTADGTWEMAGEFTRHRNYIVYCYADGYEAAEVRPEAFDPKSDARTIVRMKRRPSIPIRLVDVATGNPVPKARMMAARLGDQKYPARYISWADFENYADGHHSFDFVHHKVTDQHGLATFSRLPEGKSAMIIYAAGYQRMIVSPEDREQLTTTDGVLQIGLKKEAIVMGQLTAHGQPVIGANASIHSNAKVAGLDQMMESTKTDANGNYEFRSLAPGSYLIKVGGRSNRLYIGSDVIRHDVALQGATVQGQTSRNANVRAVPGFDAGYELIEVYSDDNGRFKLQGLTPGSHKIQTYSMDSGFRRQFSVDIDVKNVTSMNVDILGPSILLQRNAAEPDGKEAKSED